MSHRLNRNAQIGNVCIQWSNLELQLATCIWLMSGVKSEVGKILTASMDAKQRATAAFAISHQINAPVYLKTAIKTVLTELRERLIDKRNQAVHGIHFPSEQPDAALLEMHRGKGGRGRRLQTDAQVAKLGNDINRLSLDFNKSLCRYAESLKIKKLEQAQLMTEIRRMLSNINLTAAEGDTSAQSQ